MVAVAIPSVVGRCWLSVLHSVSVAAPVCDFRVVQSSSDVISSNIKESGLWQSRRRLSHWL